MLSASPGSPGSGGSASGSPGASSVNLSSRLQGVYDDFFADAKMQRTLRQAEKERRMAELSHLMNNPPDPATFNAMSEEEQAALAAGVEAEMQGGHADAKALNDELQARRAALKAESKRKKAEEQARIKRENDEMRTRIKNTGAAPVMSSDTSLSVAAQDGSRASC